MRLHALRCLSQLGPLTGAGIAAQEVLSSALDVESIHPVGVFNFRDALRHTERLRCAEKKEEERDEKDEAAEKAARLAIRFLIGRLHVQFA